MTLVSERINDDYPQHEAVFEIEDIFSLRGMLFSAGKTVIVGKVIKGAFSITDIVCLLTDTPDVVHEFSVDGIESFNQRVKTVQEGEHASFLSSLNRNLFKSGFLVVK